jgi:hypothetical protein
MSMVCLFLEAVRSEGTSKDKSSLLLSHGLTPGRKEKERRIRRRRTRGEERMDGSRKEELEGRKRR